MFGRATITLGIGPHSSLVVLFHYYLTNLVYFIINFGYIFCFLEVFFCRKLTKLACSQELRSLLQKHNRLLFCSFCAQLCIYQWHRKLAKGRVKVNLRLLT